MLNPNTHYIFSCWTARNNSYNGNRDLVSFDSVSNIIGEGLPVQEKTDLAGSWIGEDERIILAVRVGSTIWFKLFVKVYTNEKANLGSIIIKLGSMTGTTLNATSRRYFTDLRFEQIENFDVGLLDYINELKSGKLK